MKTVRIGDILKITSGGTPSKSNRDYYEGGKIPWVKTGDLKVRHLVLEKISDRITSSGLENSSAKIFPAGTVLVALYGATIGNCSILKVDAATNQACGAILPNKEVDEEYLYFYIKKIKDQLVAKGVGGAQPNISGAILKSVKIPLPDLPTQKRIAAVLDKAQGIIDRRKESLRLLEQLLRDTFLDMFGDPYLNAKRWKRFPLEKYTQKLTSGSRGWAKYYAKTGDLFLRINNVGKNELLLDNTILVDPPTNAEAKRTKVKPGDVLISITADLGRTAVIPEEGVTGYINQHLALVRLKDTLNPYFLASYVASDGGLALLDRFSKGGVKTGLNFDDIKSIPTAIPPIQLQREFELKYIRFNSLKRKLEFQLSQNENLFLALLQKAFKGELSIEKEALIEEKLDVDYPISLELSKRVHRTTSSFGIEDLQDFESNDPEGIYQGSDLNAFIKYNYGNKPFQFHEFLALSKSQFSGITYEKCQDFIFQLLDGSSPKLIQFYLPSSHADMEGIAATLQNGGQLSAVQKVRDRCQSETFPEKGLYLAYIGET